MSLPSRSLLIVDDERDIVEIVRETLAPLGLDLHSAYNGQEAMQVVKTVPLCGILCDINMPLMNGVEFLAQVRASGRQVPFVFVTAFDDRDRIMSAMRLGAFDFISKPFNTDALSDLTTRMIEVGYRIQLIENLQQRITDRDASLTQSDLDHLEKLKKMTQLFQVQNYKRST
jgi:DNA-binding NtrC family response regulator